MTASSTNVLIRTAHKGAHATLLPTTPTLPHMHPQTPTFTLSRVNINTPTHTHTKRHCFYFSLSPTFLPTLGYLTLKYKNTLSRKNSVLLISLQATYIVDSPLITNTHTHTRYINTRAMSYSRSRSLNQNTSAYNNIHEYHHHRCNNNNQTTTATATATTATPTASRTSKH